MPASRAGLFESLRQLLRTALEMAQVRLELLVSDLEIEKLRLVDAVLRALLGLLLAVAFCQVDLALAPFRLLLALRGLGGGGIGLHFLLVDGIGIRQLFLRLQLLLGRRFFGQGFFQRFRQRLFG